MDVINHQCTYCNTLYTSGNHCPTCGALVQDSIQINYTQDIKTRRSELSKEAYFNPIYKFLCILHFFTCLTWVGMWCSIPMTVLHLVNFFAMRRKKEEYARLNIPDVFKNKSIFFTIFSIIEMIICMILSVLMIAMVLIEVCNFFR